MSWAATILVGLLVVGAGGVAQATPLEVLTDKASGRMYAIRVTPTPADANALTTNPTPAQLKATADQFLRDNRTLIGVNDPARDLVSTPPPQTTWASPACSTSRSTRAWTSWAARSTST